MILDKGNYEAQGRANKLCAEMAKGVMKAVKETFSESRSFKSKGKESWWWDASVQGQVKVKKEYLKSGLV